MDGKDSYLLKKNDMEVDKPLFHLRNKEKPKA